MTIRKGIVKIQTCEADIASMRTKNVVIATVIEKTEGGYMEVLARPVTTTYYVDPDTGDETVTGGGGNKYWNMYADTSVDATISALKNGSNDVVEWTTPLAEV